MPMEFRRSLWIVLVLAGCSSTQHPAPVVERNMTPEPTISKEELRRQLARERDWRPAFHSVAQGETLYGIAFNYGVDYRDLAELNGIRDPNLISIGQQLKLFPGAVPATAQTPAVESAVAAPSPSPTEVPLKTQPKVVKYAYSEKAMAQIDKVQTGELAEQIAAKPVVASVPAALPPVPARTISIKAEAGDESLKWTVPTQGKLIAGFSEADNRKGVDIAGELGQAITASAPGKVVYSGAGLRGYGKLVIIKHNNTYLSAYAHNDKLLVKEGDVVEQGQKIAEMGQSDADRVQLHFEVRRFGKPVDPSQFVTFAAS